MDKTMWSPENASSNEEGPDPRLAAQVAALPRELEPRRDLWPEIALRLGATPDAAPGAPDAAPDAAPAEVMRPAIRRFASRGRVRHLAAALLYAAVGAAITFLSLGGGRANLPRPVAIPETQVMPAAYAAPAAPDDYRLIEADYLRAKEALWVSVYSRRDQFSPSTLEAVEKNFAIIDRAIYDLRQALDRDPGNLRLEQELYRNHRRGLDLLRRLAESA